MSAVKYNVHIYFLSQGQLRSLHISCNAMVSDETLIFFRPPSPLQSELLMTKLEAAFYGYHCLF